MINLYTPPSFTPYVSSSPNPAATKILASSLPAPSPTFAPLGKASQYPRVSASSVSNDEQYSDVAVTLNSATVISRPNPTTVAPMANPIGNSTTRGPTSSPTRAIREGKREPTQNPTTSRIHGRRAPTQTPTRKSRSSNRQESTKKPTRRSRRSNGREPTQKPARLPTPNPARSWMQNRRQPNTNPATNRLHGGINGGFYGSSYGLEWIPIEFTIRIPPHEKSFELRWEILQGHTLVAGVPFGYYGQTGMFQATFYVRPDMNFSLFMDLQFSQYGKGELRKDE